ncbi:DNA-binding protein [Arthrobacter sp. PAMC25564]|uniref:helix-turn-helix domain-containing protein n=1 Tax=Arthrobacter sp. PAMC25564 TaxID=2565366 RepID=UPI0010A22C62|nr:helix-turn-helix domain-containing protein [Arthrobacter sp. PAMC25564]QCB97099.1 DNA-binding protein [Arthrobacter sp. PAMC25564]
MRDIPLMTAAEVAAKLKVNVETVYKMCKTGRWPHTKIGRLYRFTEEHYQAIIATPAMPEQRPRTQRENIARLLHSTSYPRG